MKKLRVECLLPYFGSASIILWLVEDCLPPGLLEYTLNIVIRIQVNTTPT
jgi:hypothetical protein